jgi:ribose 5-phosphate isomerase B
VKIEIGSDHRGYALKETIIQWLRERGHTVRDWGCASADSCDYPDYAYPAARAVAASPGSLGILICSNGIGVSMVANKVPGVRAALCVTPAMADQARRHNDANLLALGAENVSVAENLRILEAWLEARFEGGRHTPRVEKIASGECLSPGRGGPRERSPDGGKMR